MFRSIECLPLLVKQSSWAIKRAMEREGGTARGRRFQKLTGFGIGIAAPVPIPISESGKNSSTFGSGYL